MKLIASIIILILIQLSCVQNNKIYKSSHTISFLDFSEKIKQINLPLSAKCEMDLKGSNFDFGNKTINKYGPVNSLIYGKLAEKEKYTVILYINPADVALPILQTNNKKGEKISSLNLYEISCWEEENVKETSWFRINKNLNIELGDSSTTFDRNDTGEIIELSKKIKVRNRTFSINSDGVIYEQKK